MLFLGNLMILAILINASVEFFEFSFKYIKKEKKKKKVVINFTVFLVDLGVIQCQLRQRNGTSPR